MKKGLQWVLIGSALVLSFAGPALAQAQEPGFKCDSNGANCTYVPLEPIPGLEQSGNTDLGTFLTSLFKILFSLSALVAVGMLTIGGIEYMVSEVPGVKAHALERAKAAIYGILILAGSWLLLNTINPQLLKFDLNFGQTGNTRGQGGDTLTFFCCAWGVATRT